MITEKEQYLINYYLHLLPLEELKNLRYPNLRADELDNEKRRLVKILTEEYKEKVFFNNCPKCQKLARTDP